jgi:hypothetical protein
MPTILRGLKTAYESAVPTALGASDADDLRFALFFLREFMRRNGHDPDPHAVVAKLMALRAKRAQQGPH